jgi:NADPH:quinone reductase-like Zn-dependent oxidoreductase
MLSKSHRVLGSRIRSVILRLPNPTLRLVCQQSKAMSSETTNQAAWSTGLGVRPLQVNVAPTGVPADNQILVKNHAVAINPIDAKLQTIAMYPLQYPAVFGQDVAGEVVAVGTNVTRFRKGQRVIGNTSFASKRSQDKGFQLYTILQCNMASEIPAAVSMESAVVIPTGLSTAACALFQPDCLNLQLPAVSPTRESTEKMLLIWGGASSLGCSAIQLAVAAGYQVLTTASPKNFELVQRLGARHVFDYKSTSVVEDLVGVANGRSVVGAMDASGRAVGPCCEFVQRSTGVKFVAAVTGGFPTPPAGVKVKSVYAPSIADTHVSTAIYQDFLPRALESGAYVPAPEALVVGRGLESIQEAMDLQSKGTSAQKVVVLLEYNDAD